MNIWEIAPSIGRFISEFLISSWWVIMPIGLFFIFINFWCWGLRVLFLQKMEWVFLEIRLPRNILKTPKAMENIFTGLHSLYSGELSWEDIYLKGKVMPWYSFEIVGYAGGVSFYVRAPEFTRNLVESAVYSEYPDAEISLADDYINFMPNVLPNNTYDIWGNDYVLSKDNPYPIKTYPYFESPSEEQRLDPVSAITEVMSKLHEGEAIWLQYLMMPVGEKWKEEGDEIRDKMYARKKPSSPPSFLGGLIDGLLEFFKNLLKGVIEEPIWADEKKQNEDKLQTPHLSPGERNVLEAVENKVSKFGFETAVRFVYIDKADEFTQLNVSAISGAFKQFGTQDMNSFKIVSDTKTFVTSSKFTTKSWFRKSKVHARKRAIYDAYRLRSIPSKTSILCTEELATIYHFPLSSVEAPLLRRLETRKGEPPVSLPIA
ncbi:hypothetical protein KJ671_00540 [Patescibacteria group bacterium]|nr:hypothetical protein [Patescibacteria group bacterium]